MTTLRLWGDKDLHLAQSRAREEVRGLEVSAVGAWRLAASRGAGAAHSVEAEPDQVVELQMASGLRWVTSVAALREDLGAVTARGTGDGALFIPTHLPFAGADRGEIGDAAIAGLRLLKVNVPEKIVDWIKHHLEPQETGLFSYVDPNERDSETRKLSVDRPNLLFLHGTASSIAGSFGGLSTVADERLWKQLTAAYGKERIFGFEHRSLSESPLSNACDLLEQLEPNAELHLVSHSRGGLIGELLCWADLAGDGMDPFWKSVEERFRKDPKDDSDRKRLSDFRRLLRLKQPKVRRFVRVACPARGTTLASRRLDRYLSLITGLLERLPLPEPAKVVLDVFSSLLLAVAKERTDPDDLPGLRAQMPESAFIGLLNGSLDGARKPITVTADLAVIAGDLEGRGFFGKLKEIATNLYYRENHDLVVNTSAMVGGTSRGEKGLVYFAKGPEVNHFSYFRNLGTAERLVAALLRPDGSQAGFEPIRPRTASELATRSGTARGGSRPVVYLLPGIMGSHLAVPRKDPNQDLDRIWLDVVDLAGGRMSELAITAPNVTAEAVMASTYGKLGKFLANSNEVVPFPFDWRRSLRIEAARLASALEEELARTSQPVRLLAHSMGGVLARAMIALRPDLWKRLRERDGRLVMLGTPTEGAYVPVAVLLGRERILKMLAVLDAAHGKRGMLEIVARYPGLLELLPKKVDENDPKGIGDYFFRQETWEELRETDKAAGDWGDWLVPEKDALQSAWKLRELLDDESRPVTPDGMAYVAGRADETPCDLRVSASSGRIQIQLTPEGDGRVPWATGIPKGVTPWYVDEVHGDLPAHRRSFAGYAELLATGKTSLLSSTPPARRAAAAPRWIELPANPELVEYPNQEELTAEVLGGRAHRPVETGPTSTLRLEVAHGDLSNAPGAVLVGHYVDDVIVGAEWVLNCELDGRLADRLRIGTYPGPSGTHAVIFNPHQDRQPNAGIVVGLGHVGSLTPRKIQDAVFRGLVEYAIALEERQPDPMVVAAAADVFTVLVGTGDGSVSLADSVESIARGALEAMGALAERGRTLRRLVFVELYLDRAAPAAQALADLAASPRFQDRLDIATTLGSLDGGLERISYTEAPGWWRRLEVRAQDGSLRFTPPTRRARAEEADLKVQRNVIDSYLAAATGSTARDVGVAQTLFELLVPRDLKNRAADREDLLYVLDDDSAQYPWELLDDRFDKEREPAAVRAGLIRQLRRRSFRRAVNQATDGAALVVGDPNLEGMTGFAPLPGAQNEARLVTDILGKSFPDRITTLIKASANSVIDAIFEQRWRVLHLSGHGVHQWRPDPKSPETVTGMVIGPNLYLGQQEIDQMRFVPELVFLNCCYLGRVQPDRLPATEQQRSRLAANLATQFIQMGVRAIVAAGWAVDDDAALTFARAFYDELLSGKTFGKAVLEARRRTYFSHPTSNTWGAYQCYGDPDWTLKERTTPRRRTSSWVASQELVRELGFLASRARAQGSPGGRDSEEERRRIMELCEEIRTLRKVAEGHGWLTHDSQLHAAFGRAFAEVECFDCAVEHYDRAVSCERPRLTVVDLEQLANLRARQAIVEWRKTGDATKPREMIEASLQELLALPVGAPVNGATQMERSAERASLLGASYKRLSIVAGSSAKGLAALEEAANAYEQAHLRKLATTLTIDPNPALNSFLLRGLLGDPRRKQVLCNEVAGAAEAARVANSESRSFWNEVTAADSELVTAVLNGNLPDRIEEVAASYERNSLLATPREWRSIDEHLEWLEVILGSDVPLPGVPARRRKALHAGVARLRRRLFNPVPPPMPPEPQAPAAAAVAQARPRSRRLAKPAKTARPVPPPPKRRAPKK